MARFLALDWDHQQLHVVSATISGGGVRIQRAAVWHEQQSPNPIEAETLGQLLKERLKSAGIAPAPVLICIGRDRVVLKEVRYPTVSDHEEPAIVRFQAVKQISDPPEEVVIDYAVAETSATGERRALVLVVRREMLLTYQSLCKAAGLKLAGLTPRPFGTVTCLRRLIGTTVLTPAPEPPDAAVAVLTTTDKWAEFCILRGETLVLARSLPVGPGLPGEVRRSLAVHAGQSPQCPVKAVYVAGSGEQGALRQRLNELLGVPVHFFDPFAGIEGPELPATNRGAFAGAVGLLHTQTDKRGAPINFAKPKQPKPPQDPNKKRLLVAAAVFGLFFLGGVGYCYAKLAEKDREVSELYRQKSAIDKELLLFDEDAKRIKAIDDWSQSGIVWLDELYDLTDRFPDVSSMRLVQLAADPLQRSAKEKHAAKLALKGIVTDEYQMVDTLIARLVEDGHYRVDPKQMSRNPGLDRFRFPQQFTTRVDVEKQPPTKYTRRLSVAAPGEGEQPERGRRVPGGGPGGRRPPGGGGGGRFGPGGNGFDFDFQGGQP